MNIKEILKNYDLKNLSIGALGGHSALDVCHGAKKHGFRTVVVAVKGRDKTYSRYYKTRGKKGCVDEVVLVDKFEDVLKPQVQEKLRKLNTIFIHNRYFWVYFNDYGKIENDFKVPIFGLREGVKLEERDQPLNQYHLLAKAGVRMPLIVRSGNSGIKDDKLKKILDDFFKKGGGPLVVKVSEALRTYERAFFIITNSSEYFLFGKELIEKGKIKQEALDRAVIEEFIIGAQVNFNYFYSTLTGELELMGTDTRRQTSLDGFLRLNANTQTALLRSGYKPTMIETGHIACTTKESIIEKAYEAGEKFVKTVKELVPPGIIGPFALQGAMGSYDGKEEFVTFDVSMRIPGSPGTKFTPYTGYMYGEPISYGERIAMEIKEAAKRDMLLKILT